MFEEDEKKFQEENVFIQVGEGRKKSFLWLGTPYYWDSRVLQIPKGQ